MKQGGKLTLVLIALFAFSVPTHAVSVLKVANGQVKDISVSEKKITLSFEHPVTGEAEELMLHVDDQTGFPESSNLDDFKKGEPLTVDYEEDESGNCRAVQIKRVPLSGVSLDG